MEDHDRKSLRAVFYDLCDSSGLKAGSRDTREVLAGRYLHYLLDKVTSMRCPYIALFVDEAQRLVPRQFNAFAELYDKLERKHVSLSVVFVSNEQESTALFNTIMNKSDYAHVRGRFFHRVRDFYGLTNEADVKYCMGQFDVLRYPKDGPTYTEHFLPKEVAAGWRFASLSKDVWRIYAQYKKAYKIRSWGMKYFGVAICTLLSDYLPRFGVDAFEDEMFRECIKISQLIPDLTKSSND